MHALTIRGRSGHALRELDGVLELDLDTVGRARATAQRAVLLSHLGRYDQAPGPPARHPGAAWGR